MAPKLLAGAFEPFFGITGLVCAIVGFFTKTWPAFFAGMFSFLATIKYLTDTVSLPRSNMFLRFARAFGPGWPERLVMNTSPEQRRAMLPQRWTWWVPKKPEPGWLRNVPYWIDPDTRRILLCDVWSPPKGVPLTGMGVVYFHGSSWCLGDKDFGTRDFFRHLASKGHVIMDAQYRLIPETDMAGMILDAKQAIAWLKVNAEKYRLNPKRLVTAGFSSGAWLALMTAYTADNPQLTPIDLLGEDLSVCGAVSYAGSYDLRVIYFQSNQPPTPYKKLKAIGENQTFHRISSRLIKFYTGDENQAERISDTFANLALAGQMKRILSGTPDEIPEVYTRYSPITYAAPTVPPTFLAQGADDLWVPVEIACQLANKLHAAGVPVINLILPHAEHGFDLVLPRISPPAQSTLYELDRFLALL